MDGQPPVGSPSPLEIALLTGGQGLPSLGAPQMIGPPPAPPQMIGPPPAPAPQIIGPPVDGMPPVNAGIPQMIASPPFEGTLPVNAGAQQNFSLPPSDGMAQTATPPTGNAAADWNCPSCGDMQFARNTHCRLCGCPRDGGDDWRPVYGKNGGKDKGNWSAPYDGKAWGKGKGKSKGKHQPGTIASLIDGLINDGLPGGHCARDINALYLANLPYDTTEHDLYCIFGTFGAIPPKGVKVMQGIPGQRTYGFANFLDPASAEFARMALNGVTMPDGVKLIVKPKNPKPGKGEAGDMPPPPPQLAIADMMASAPAIGQPAGPPAGVDPEMWGRLKQKVAESGQMTSYDLSQWYIIQHLGHVVDEEAMKSICDMLLSACSQLGLS